MRSNPVIPFPSRKTAPSRSAEQRSNGRLLRAAVFLKSPRCNAYRFEEIKRANYGPRMREERGRDQLCEAPEGPFRQ
jgi:hypothetical protein